MKPKVLSFRERLALSLNSSTVRPTTSRPVNASQMFPKRPLLSATMSRYLAKAKADAAPRPVTSSTSETSAHVVVKRFVIPLMMLDDFVLDIED